VGSDYAIKSTSFLFWHNLLRQETTKVAQLAPDYAVLNDLVFFIFFLHDLVLVMFLIFFSGRSSTA